MCSVFKNRASTKDIDAIYDTTLLDHIVRSFTQKYKLTSDWLKDFVKCAVPKKQNQKFDTYMNLSNLKVFTAPAEMMLAMKCEACRVGKNIMMLWI